MTIAEDGPESVLVYVHDPMCSWCYGFRPTWKALKSQLPEGLPVVSLLGGLADDSDISMPLEMVDYLKRTWERIESTCKVPLITAIGINHHHRHGPRLLVVVR